MLKTLFGDKTIRSRVLSIIESRIQSAQEKYEIECDNIDAEAENAKEKSAEKLVQDIVGKVL